MREPSCQRQGPREAAGAHSGPGLSANCRQCVTRWCTVRLPGAGKLTRQAHTEVLGRMLAECHQVVHGQTARCRWFSQLRCQGDVASLLRKHLFLSSFVVLSAAGWPARHMQDMQHWVTASTAVGLTLHPLPFLRTIRIFNISLDILENPGL